MHVIYRGYGARFWGSDGGVGEVHYRAFQQGGGLMRPAGQQLGRRGREGQGLTHPSASRALSRAGCPCCPPASGITHEGTRRHQPRLSERHLSEDSGHAPGHSTAEACSQIPPPPSGGQEASHRPNTIRRDAEHIGCH